MHEGVQFFSLTEVQSFKSLNAGGEMASGGRTMLKVESRQQAITQVAQERIYEDLK